MITEFNVKIKTENSAFEENGIGLETARILRVIADKIEQSEADGNCIDYNGNKVGFWGFH